MAGPWEKYAQPAAPAPTTSAGPWQKYGGGTPAPTTPEAVDPRYQTPFVSPANNEATSGGPIPIPTADTRGVGGAPASAMDRFMNDIADAANIAGPQALDVAASAADGLRQGVAAIAGLPVEAVNAAPVLANILPGEQGMTPMSDRPVMGSRDIDTLLRLGSPQTDSALIPNYEPQTASGRFANRVGEEIGATAVPLGAAAGVAGRMGLEGVREMGPLARSFVEPMAVAPGRVAGRELVASTAAGTGAQAANEIADPSTGEGTWWSDLLGALGGTGALGATNVLAGFARNAYGAATGRTGAFDDVAGAAVVDRLVDNSSRMQADYAEGGASSVDTNSLARALSIPSAAEETIPGFRANIADRVNDPGLSSLVYNTDATLPGAANARRVANAAAIDQRMQGLAPGANPAGLREALEIGAGERISNAEAARAAAAAQADTAAAAVNPAMAPVDRGVAIRGGLTSARDAAMDAVAQLYGAVDSAVPADMTGLRDRIAAVVEGLPLNDRARFLPPEVGVAETLAATDPIRPISEAMAIRSGLASDIRSPSATDQQRRVTGQVMDATEDFIRSALPEEQIAALDAAKSARLDAGRRFEDRGAVPDILRETGRGQPALPPEAVPGRALRGQTDYQDVMREAGSDPAARAAVADQLLADAQRSNALRSPEALTRFLQERNVMFSDFPEARTALEQAGASRQALNAAERAAQETTRALSPGGTSAPGRYLKYDDTQTRTAIGTAWRSAQPERAVRELLDVAGDTPQTRASARAALWEEVAGTGKLDAPTMTSGDNVTRWSGRRLKNLFDDPRFAKTAEVLWEDNPEHLADVRGVVDALSKVDGSINAKTPGTSGTAQSLSGKFDPALSTASIASRARSVNRGQLSPTIAVVDVLSTALRNRSARVQSRAIEELMSRAVNDPELAATLLRRYNPADEAAESRAFLNRFGVRIPTVANILADVENDEDDAIERMGAQ